MAQDLAKTVNELTLLGWSEDAAKNYTELLNSNGLTIFSSDPYNLTVFLIISLLFLIIFISTQNHLNKSRKVYSTLHSNAIKNNKESIDKPIATSSNETNKPQTDVNRNQIPTNKISIIKVLEALKVIKSNTAPSIKSSENIQQKKSLKKPLQDLLNETSIDTNIIADSIIKVSIMAFSLTSKLIKSSSKDLGNKKDVKYFGIGERYLFKLLSKKDDPELRSLLEGEELLSSLSREQLINLIYSNKLIVEKLALEEKEKHLMRKTNAELKTLLKGMRNISGLRKKELVRKILALENKAQNSKETL